MSIPQLLKKIDSEYKSYIRYVGRVNLLKAIFVKQYCGSSKSWEESIDEALNTLPERERQILELRFGLGDGNFLSLDKVGKAFGVTRERIRQIEGKALRKLRQPARKRVLLGESWEAAVQESKSIGEELLLERFKPNRLRGKDNRRLEELDLPVRIVNSLYKAGYNRVWQVKELKDKDLLKIRNIGPRSIEYVKRSIGEK